MSSTAFANKRVVNTKGVIASIFKMYDRGEYQKAISGLDKIQTNVVDHVKNRKDIQGLVFYWKGLCYIKLNEFEQANSFLEKAIEFKFNTSDLYYEYAQSLYALDKLKKARIAFKKSVKKKYKVAVSLYYIAYISQQLKDFKKAVVFYNAIDKLPDEDKKDVIQAARMQVADIYLKQVEKMPNTFRSVQKYVIPQYKKALKWDENSKLADDIREKIVKVQKRYDLLLFKMRNGVPTADPRYFIKMNTLYGTNSNVTQVDGNTLSTLEATDYSSAYYTAGAYARYSFYPNSTYSISPEIDINYTKYLSDSDSIKPSNNLNYRAGIQMNYEHIYNNAPATFYLNLDYIQNEDDSDADDKIEKESTTTAVTFSEGVQVFKGHPSTFRYKFSSTEAVLTANSSITHSLIWEQLINRGNQSFFIYSAYDISRFGETETNNTNAFTVRGDWILPTLWGAINPNLFLSNRLTNYIEDADRGVTSLMSYGLSLNRPISSKWYMTFDYVQDAQTADQDSDNFSATKMSLNLDYIY